MRNVQQKTLPLNAINITPAALQPSNLTELTIKSSAEPVKESNMSKLLASC